MLVWSGLVTIGHVWSCGQNRPIMTMWYFEAHKQGCLAMDRGSKHHCIHEEILMHNTEIQNDAMFEKDYQADSIIG